MRTWRVMLQVLGGILLLSLCAWAADAPPTVVKSPAPQAPAPAAALDVAPAPPPSAPPQRGAAELEKLVAPIALYPDPLVATILPASVYPLEIVQAARFVANTNNLAQLDAQSWDENVKAVARVPEVIKKLNDDLQWTISLGEAFLAQEKDVMEAIQKLRGKAQQAGTLQTTPQQVVVVTNEVVQKTVEQQVVVVTNTIVQIQPSNPQVVYVPTYDPMVVYAPPPAYVYNPVAPLVTFGVGVAVGAVIANNCDWHGGGVYVGHHGVAVWGGGGHGDVDVDVNRNVNINNQQRARSTTSTGQQKWQPDPNRVRTSGAAGTAASSAEARGWSSGTSPASTRATGTRTASGSAPTRTGAGTAPAPRASAASAPSRPSSAPSASPSRSAPSTRSAPSRGSAFSGVNSGASARSYSSRGAASRGGGGRGGGRR